MNEVIFGKQYRSLKPFIIQSSPVLLFACPSWAQMLSSKPYSETSLAYVSPSARENMLRAFIQQAKYSPINFNLVLAVLVGRHFLEIVFNGGNQTGYY
jgi:hypothetical protein